jgi:hypothetical protein
MTDNSIGTWKRNIGKSQYSTTPTNPVKTNTVVRAEVPPDGGTFSGATVTATGSLQDDTPINAYYSMKYDGTDYQVTGQVWDTISVTQQDPNNFTFVTKKAGTKYSSGTTNVSADGLTLTTTASGFTADGKPFKNILVYDRV